MIITAMTYNICSGMNLARKRDLAYAASVINEVQSDFVTLNEVRSHTSDVPLCQATELGRLCGYYPVFGKSLTLSSGGYGNAFLTRHPLVEWEVVHIPDRKSDEKVYFEHRSILRALLDVNGKRVTVLGTHFGLAKVEQESAVETMLSVIAKETNPVIVMGDLNLTPDNERLAPLFEALHDTAYRQDAIKTFPSDVPTIKIDYILHTEGLRTLSVYSIDTQCSDHRPLIAELEVL